MFRGAEPLGGPPPALVALDRAWWRRTRADDEAARTERDRMIDVCMVALVDFDNGKEDGGG